VYKILPLGAARHLAYQIRLVGGFYSYEQEVRLQEKYPFPSLEEDRAYSKKLAADRKSDYFLRKRIAEREYHRIRQEYDARTAHNRKAGQEKAKITRARNLAAKLAAQNIAQTAPAIKAAEAVLLPQNVTRNAPATPKIEPVPYTQPLLKPAPQPQKSKPWYEKPYVFYPNPTPNPPPVYPKWLYSPLSAPLLILNQQEESILGPLWFHSPTDAAWALIKRPLNFGSLLTSPENVSAYLSAIVQKLQDLRKPVQSPWQSLYPNESF